VRETRRALRRHRERLPAPVREQLHQGAVGLEKAGAAGDRTAQRRGLVHLDGLVDEHLGFAKKSTTREYVESIAIAVLIALALRACVVEAFKIPSGSMIPTMEIGDHIFVNKFLYGLHIPFTETKLFQWRKPRRGEVIVFVYPCDRNKDFIKRIVAVEGDTVEVRCNQVYVNNMALAQQPVPGACTYWDKDDKDIGFGSKIGRDDSPQDISDNPPLCPDSRGKTWAQCNCSRYHEHNGDQSYHTIYDPHRPREAAGDVREFDFPREGPMSPSPSKPWHLAQAASNVSLPREEVPPACAAASPPSHDSKAAGSITSTVVRMTACWMPQNSAHWPAKVPVRRALKSSTFVRPGIASRLPVSAGTHQLWATSGAVSSSRTVRSTGTRRTSSETTPFG